MIIAITMLRFTIFAVCVCGVGGGRYAGKAGKAAVVVGCELVDWWVDVDVVGVSVGAGGGGVIQAVFSSLV